MLKRKVPRLRRVSVSPWCGTEKAAEALEDKYIYSWKPNPAMIVGNFDQEKIGGYIGRTLKVAKDCIVEIILKGIFPINQEPARIQTWIQIAKREIESRG